MSDSNKSLIYHVVIRSQIVVVIVVCALFASPPGALCLDMAKKGYIGAFPVAAPMSIASDGVSRLYIASRGGRITVTDLEGTTLSSFGGAGSALEKELFEPSGMFYSDGKLYIADSWTGHVAVLDPDGALLDVYGRKGNGRKEFSEPGDIHVRGGLIYVSDTGNSRVQVLGPNGVYLMNFGRTGGVQGKLHRPISLAVGDNDMVYVVDELDKWLKLYNPRGEYINKIPRFRVPVEVALTGNGVVVADAHEGMLRFLSAEGDTIGAIGPWGKHATPFGQISGLVAVGDMVYAGDLKGNEVKVFRVPVAGVFTGENRRALLPFAEYGSETAVTDLAPGKLVSANSGEMYVLDLASERIMRLEQGSGAVPAGPEECRAVSFALNAGGDIYCLDADKGRVVVSGPEGDFKMAIELKAGRGGGKAENPVDLGVSSMGEIFIADRGTGHVLVYGPSGAYRGRLGLGGTSFYIQDPVALRVTGKDLVYVADAANRTVYIYSSEGRLIREVWDTGIVGMPGALAVSDDFIYMLDTAVPDIKVFDKTGMLLMSFGSEGGGKGEFRSPVSIEADDRGGVVVSDTGNKRVQRLGVHISPAHIKEIRKSLVTNKAESEF